MFRLFCYSAIINSSMISIEILSFSSLFPGFQQIIKFRCTKWENTLCGCDSNQYKTTRNAEFLCNNCSDCHNGKIRKDCKHKLKKSIYQFKPDSIFIHVIYNNKYVFVQCMYLLVVRADLFPFPSYFYLVICDPTFTT